MGISTTQFGYQHLVSQDLDVAGLPCILWNGQGFICSIDRPVAGYFSLGASQGGAQSQTPRASREQDSLAKAVSTEGWHPCAAKCVTFRVPVEA